MTELLQRRRRYDDSVQAQIARWVVRAVGAGAMAAIGWLFHTVMDLQTKTDWIYWALKWKGVL